MCYKADTPYKVNVCVLYPALMTLLISCLHRFLVASHYMYVRPPRTLPVSLPPFPIVFSFLLAAFSFFPCHRLHRTERVTRDLVMMTPAGNVHEGPIHRDQEPIPVYLRPQWPSHHESIILLLFLSSSVHLWLLLAERLVARGKMDVARTFANFSAKIVSDVRKAVLEV